MLRLACFTTCFHYFRTCSLTCLLACLFFFLLANLLAASRSLLFLSNSSIHPGFAIIFHGFDLPAKKMPTKFYHHSDRQNILKISDTESMKLTFRCSKQSASPVSWFSIECHKSKLKVIRKVIQEHVSYHREPMRT